jgi:hypothetical protein
MKQLYLSTLILLASCSQTNTNIDNHEVAAIEQKQDPSYFLPKGYVIFENIKGDLNKDGIEDCVLIIKGTDKSKIVIDEYQGELDRNRRGIIVFVQQK